MSVDYFGPTKGFAPVDLGSIKDIDLARGGDGSAKSIRETYRMCSAGELPVFKLGSKWRGRRSTIQAHVEQLEQRRHSTAQEAPVPSPKPKSKVGRPRIPDDQKRRHDLRISATDSLKRRMRKVAEIEGCSMPHAIELCLERYLATAWPELKS